MSRKFQPTDCYYCKTRYHSDMCTLPYHFVADLTLPEDTLETAFTLAELHINHAVYINNLSSYVTSTQQSERSQSINSVPQTPATQTFDSMSQGGVPIFPARTEQKAATQAEPLSPKTVEPTQATIEDASMTVPLTEALTDTSAVKTSPIKSKSILVPNKGKAKAVPTALATPATTEVTKVYVPAHELPSISRDITLSVTFAHLLRTKLLKDVTLRQFYDCTFDTVNKSKSDAQARLKDYPDTLKSLSRNFIKNLEPNTLDSWFHQKQPPHPGASEFELVNHPLFNCQPAEKELKYRLDNSLIRFALTSTYTGKVNRAFITTFHSSIKKQLTDHKSERLFDWLTKVRKDSSLAYDKDVNFYTLKPGKINQKQAPTLALETKHSCPPQTEATQRFFTETLPRTIGLEISTLEKFKLPTVPGYTSTELITDLFVELISHFPIWIRPNFIATTAHVESITQFLSLALTTPDQTNILWTLNALLPLVKSRRPI